MFVLLEHLIASGADPPADRHWDLLVDTAGSERVPTWRLALNPLAAAGPIPAERLPDHRRLYLEYEGPLSGGRGRVQRVDHGAARVARLDGDELTAELDGTHLRGRFEIVHRAPGALVFRRA